MSKRAECCSCDWAFVISRLSDRQTWGDLIRSAQEHADSAGHKVLARAHPAGTVWDILPGTPNTIPIDEEVRRRMGSGGSPRRRELAHRETEKSPKQGLLFRDEEAEARRRGR